VTSWVIVAERVEYLTNPGPPWSDSADTRKVVERRAVGPYTQEQADAMLSSLNMEADWEAWKVALGAVPATFCRPSPTVHPPRPHTPR
jgi:hypothetical protein